MSQAEELLNALSETGITTYTATPETEPHIVIGEDRIVIVPDELKRIAVQYDHNIETVTFDCPRYWDGLDMSQMSVRINYKRADKQVGCYKAQNVTVDETDTNIMHFDWTVSRNVTEKNGNIVFLVCVKKVDDDDYEVNHWNSELCNSCYISEGLECDDETIVNDYPDYLASLEQEYAASFEALKAELIAAKDAGEFDGDDGISPTITVTSVTGGHKLTVVDINGGTEFVVSDGVSPTVSVSDTSAGHTVAITDANGTKTINLTDGEDGASIETITRTAGTGAAGSDDTYTIALTDGRTSTFQVHNGTDGTGAGDMTTSVYDPQRKNTDIFAYVDNVSSSITTGDTTTLNSAKAYADGLAGNYDTKGSADQALTDAKAYADGLVGDINTVLDSLIG